MTPVLLSERLAELSDIELLSGAHAPDHKFCFMELVAYLAGEPHTDHPSCASPVLGAFIRPLNDWMTDTERQLLKPFVVRTFGTVGARAQEQQRAWLLADWAVRLYAPLALRAVGLDDQAVALEGLPAVVGVRTSRRAKAGADAAAAAARAAYAASAAARAAASSAAAARAAASSAARAAAAAARAADYAAAAAAWALRAGADRGEINKSALALLAQLIAVTETDE